MIKRILLCIIVFVLIFSFVSCNKEEESYNTASRKNTVTLVCPENGEIDGTSIEVVWGEVYKLPKPTKEHYVFNGWICGDKLLDSTGIWSFSSDATLIASWNPKAYPINYNMYPHFGEAVDSYTVETEEFALLTPPSVSGKMFLGWTSEEIDTPTKYITVPKGSFGGKTYVAHWISVDEIENKQDNFVFEIVDDHAVVVGYCGENEEELFIPQQFNGYPVTTIGNSAFYGLGKFTNMLNIPSVVTVIEDNAIGGCKGLPINILGADPQEWHQNATIGKNNGGLTK